MKVAIYGYKLGVDEPFARVITDGSPGEVMGTVKMLGRFGADVLDAEELPAL